MSKTVIGLIFILAGLSYGSLAFDGIYEKTLGWLVKNQWLNPPIPDQVNKNALGRKPTIALYAIGLIIIGLYILWNRQI